MTAFEISNRIAQILLSLACLASVVTWGFAIRGFFRARLPLERVNTPKVHWEPWTVLAAFATWILTDQIVYSALQITPEAPIVERIQALCLGGALKTLLLLELLYVSSGIRGVDLFPDRRVCLADMRAGGWGFLFSLLPVGSVIWLTAPLRNEQNGHALIRILREHPEINATIGIGIAVLVIAPLFEELLFRVVLQGWLQEQVPPATAITLVAIVFAFVHGNSWPDPLPLFPLAWGFGYLYYRRRSYFANVVMHALFNGFNFLMVLITTE